VAPMHSDVGARLWTARSVDRDDDDDDVLMTAFTASRNAADAAADIDDDDAGRREGEDASAGPRLTLLADAHLQCVSAWPTVQSINDDATLQYCTT